MYGRLSGERTRDDRSDGLGDAWLGAKIGGVLGREFGPIDLLSLATNRRGAQANARTRSQISACPHASRMPR